MVEKEKNQTKVWSKVDELTNANKSSTPTKTYNAISQSGEFKAKLEKYLAFFRSKFDNDDKVVGVVVVSGSKVIGCDIFANHDLFIKQYPSLLHSYITEAIINGKAVNISTSVVKAYTDKLLESEVSQQNTLKEKGSSFTNQGKKLRVSSYD